MLHTYFVLQYQIPCYFNFLFQFYLLQQDNASPGDDNSSVHSEQGSEESGQCVVKTKSGGRKGKKGKEKSKRDRNEKMFDVISKMSENMSSLVDHMTSSLAPRGNSTDFNAIWTQLLVAKLNRIDDIEIDQLKLKIDTMVLEVMRDHQKQ